MQHTIWQLTSVCFGTVSRSHAKCFEKCFIENEERQREICQFVCRRHSAISIENRLSSVNGGQCDDKHHYFLINSFVRKRQLELIISITALSQWPPNSRTNTWRRYHFYFFLSSLKNPKLVSSVYVFVVVVVLLIVAAYSIYSLAFFFVSLFSVRLICRFAVHKMFSHTRAPHARKCSNETNEIEK